MDRNSEIYKMTAAINKARKHSQIWNQKFEERYVTDNFYAFQRGKFLVATTNSHNTQTITVPNSAFSNGEKVCNIFNTSDCQTVNNNSVNVSLQNGEAKIYISKSNSFFDDFMDETND